MQQVSCLKLRSQRRWSWGTTLVQSPCEPETHRRCFLYAALWGSGVREHNVGKLRWKLMENLWKTHGKLMEHSRATHGELMENLWKTHEKSTCSSKIWGFCHGAVPLLQVELCKPGAVLHIENAQIAARQGGALLAGELHEKWWVSASKTPSGRKWY